MSRSTSNNNGYRDVELIDADELHHSTVNNTSTVDIPLRDEEYVATAGTAIAGSNNNNTNGRSFLSILTSKQSNNNRNNNTSDSNNPNNISPYSALDNDNNNSSQSRSGYNRLYKSAAIILLITGLILLGYFIGLSVANKNSNTNPLSNRANNNNPIVILLSFDGFRAQYLDEHREVLPNIHSLISDSLYSPMQPVFPSVTFPNHYSIVTGLYPQHSGITENDMYDSELNKYFHLSSTEVKNSQWWTARQSSLWNIAKPYGIPTGSIMWPGSDIDDLTVAPDQLIKFNRLKPNSEKLTQLLEWIDNGKCELCLSYFFDADSAAHHYGPHNTEKIRIAMSSLDTLVGDLKSELIKRNLYKSNRLSLIIASDHGMTSILNPTIYLDNYITNTASYRVIAEGTTAEVVNNSGFTIDEIYQQLLLVPNITVYKKDQIPAEYHFKDNIRIQPLLLTANLGFLIAKSPNKPLIEAGAHGYNNTFPDMQAIFIAHSNKLQRNIQMKSVYNPSTGINNNLLNLSIYPLICWLLNISPPPNNGTFQAFIPYLASNIPQTFINLP